LGPGISIKFIEPNIPSKRKGVAYKRLGKEEITADELQKQITELRKTAVKNTKNNMNVLKKNISKNKNMTLFTATNPKQIVKYIETQTKDLGFNRIDMNRSNTLRTIKPELLNHGFQVVHTYNHAIKSGNLGVFGYSEPGQYWTLGQLELENKFQSFNANRRPMAYTRELIDKATGKGKFIGLVGANVMAASGEILAVQHLRNITSILTHATKSFIVITLDKLVNDLEQALFQARCTAMYGLEQIILDSFDIERLRGEIESKGKQKKKEKEQNTNKNKAKGKQWKSLKDSYYEPYKPPENLHIIILDDQRSKLIGTKTEDLLYCIGCRKCGLLCPRVRIGKQKPNTVEDLAEITFTLTARELLMDGLLYGPEFAIDEGLFDCSLCRSCSNVCPVGIDLAEHLQVLRQQCQKKDLFSEPHKKIRNNILQVGNAYGSEFAIKTSPGGHR
jgi:L-lactate utilization protein LutB